VHGDIRPPLQQRGFQLLHEQALAAHLGQRHIQQLVTAGRHAQQFYGEAGVRALQL